VDEERPQQARPPRVLGVTSSNSSPPRMRIPLKALCLALVLPAGLRAQSDSLALPLVDDPVAARLDELAQLPWIKYSPFTSDTAAHNRHGFAAAEVPTWPEETMRYRLAVLDEA